MASVGVRLNAKLGAAFWTLFLHFMVQPTLQVDSCCLVFLMTCMLTISHWKHVRNRVRAERIPTFPITCLKWVISLSVPMPARSQTPKPMPITILAALVDGFALKPLRSAKTFTGMSHRQAMAPLSHPCPPPARPTTTMNIGVERISAAAQEAIVLIKFFRVAM